MNLIHELNKGILKWYTFSLPCKVLCIGSELDCNNPIAECLIEMGTDCFYLPMEQIDEESTSFQKEKYDYAVLIGSIEYARNPTKFLSVVRESLKSSGILLLASDNRLGIRYFCGDRDPFTGRNFDSVENYLRINPADRQKMEGRLYSKAELTYILNQAGFGNRRFYSVFPDISSPQVLISEDYMLNEELNIRIFPHYNYPNTVFLEEESLYSTLLENNMFHSMANGFLIECPLNGVYSNTLQITVSMDRGPENGMCTIIRKDNQVEKRALYKDGMKKLYQLVDNNKYLQKHGIHMIDARIDNNSLVMPYVDGIPLVTYFRELIKSDKEKFLSKMDYFWNLIKNSSEHVPYDQIDWECFEPGWEHRKADDPKKDKWRKIAFGTLEEQENLGVILKRGFIDLVVLNGFYKDSDFLFFDQELYVKHLPAKAIFLRNIDFIYQYNTSFELILPRKELLKRYQILEYQDLFYKFIWRFLNKLRNEEELSKYNKEHRRNADIINGNRQRMNYSEEEYNHMFRDIFRHAEGRKIYLFGSGNFAEMFLSQFGSDFDVTGIVDNQEQKWGTQIHNIPIMNPDILKTLDFAQCKVIVCIKNYVPVVKQLTNMGIKNFSIYDSGMEYPCKNRVTTNNKYKKNKKYNIGYVAGVFDLFHIGHLNLLKRAKDQCNYLIVGVVSDEGVRNHKRSNPEIPFVDRIDIVRACRYVDEAVEIPLDRGGTDEAYRRYQFDVQFSGSDYINDPVWIANKEFLQRRGADLIFFPYTESISSTKLKAVIREKKMY